VPRRDQGKRREIEFYLLARANESCRDENAHMAVLRKSTQVPQLLYESGFTLGSSALASSPEDAIDRSPKYLIGVTQPRRGELVAMFYG
jgi:hypothetical protein